ncbi:hypothetical protein IQ247_12185 [Plectonema cf. radiosum LEGE 06105]|uniref:DUF2281 domain-containing protein n=1 Tax=Plectonema cf. radiosum LEGE 06105 TaxID=945769 RepID=A0A8J7JUH3_9CYAN|nr:hypothetical protein [Plectonema radiosum]MBE9213415.1 hypothetical protein [Plectonema cf. radiosum LEGE 06105]
MNIDELIRQAEQLSPDEQLRLAEYLVESARKQYRAFQFRPPSSDIQESEPNRFPEDISNEQVSGVKIVQERKPGLYPGAFVVHDDFDQPLPDAFWLGEE